MFKPIKKSLNGNAIEKAKPIKNIEFFKNSRTF
jgi:hypothetical protein